MPRILLRSHAQKMFRSPFPQLIDPLLGMWLFVLLQGRRRGLRPTRGRIRPESGMNMANDTYENAFEDLLLTHVSLDESPKMIVRQPMKTRNPGLAVHHSRIAIP
jgi:hypothetical protein